MAADLTTGTVPAFYRELYDILCPTQENGVDQDMFVKMLVKSSLPKQTLTQIWEMVDTSQGCLSRSGLFKALALVAFAQQGKPVDEKLLMNFSGDELPKPSLGDLTDLRVLSIRLRREKNPNRLGLTFDDVCALDSVHVTVIPEKKGLFLKHIEYEVMSERSKATVQRRYNDFVALHEILLQKFPYRMIPQLPPKKVMGADSPQFIEERRKALKRFLNLLARHPVLSEDKIIQFFLTFAGTDVQNRMKEHFRGVLDEYQTNELAKNAEELLPFDTVNQLSVVKEQMKNVYSGMLRLRDSAERIVERSKGDSSDMILIGKELCSFATSSGSESDWGTGGNQTWDHLRRGLKTLYPVFPNVSNAFIVLATEEEEGVVEELNLFLDLLSSYMDLCERYDTFVNFQKQRALSKVGRRVSSSQIAADAEAQVQYHQEKRNFFFLHCIHMETQLVHAYVEIIGRVMQSITKLQSAGYMKIASLWQEALPTVDSLLPNNNQVNNSTTPSSTISR